MFASPPPLMETDRLLLRPLTMDDLEPLAALYRDPDIRRHFPEGTLTLDETREELAWIIDVYYAQYGYGLWATLDRATGAFIGRCGLIPWTLDGRPEVEVAYLLDRRYWGRGLATEAAQAIRDYAFQRLGLTRLICLVEEANHASIKVAQKIGMRLERAGADDKGPYLLYALHRPAP